MRAQPGGGLAAAFPAPNLRPAAWAQLHAAYVATAEAWAAGRRSDAYAALQGGVQPMLELFREDEEAWLTEPLHALVDTLRFVAEGADAELEARGRKPNRLENAGNHLMTCFSAAHRAQGNRNKRLATLKVANCLFQVYFKLNTLRLCKNIIRAVEARNFVDFNAFPVGQRVTNRFFVGRLSVFDDRFLEADEQLSYAFRHCPRSSTHNKGLILQYLLPVKLLLGQLPRPALREQYRLDQMYGGVIRAMQTGSVRDLDEALELHLPTYIRAGTYLVLEKLRFAVMRRLLKRTLLLGSELRPGKPKTQLPLGLYQAALRWQGVDMELDEVECVVANMIYRRYVKGYIAHKNRILVVSKIDPFPSLHKVLLEDPGS